MRNDKNKEKKIKRGKGFNPFDMNRDGKGATVEDTTPNLKYFFKQFFRKFPKLLSINLLALFMIVPIIIGILIYIWGPTTPVMIHTESIPMLGIRIFEGENISPATSVFIGAFSAVSSLPMVTPINMVLITLCGIILFITWGWQNVGITYLMRGLVRGDPVFILSDYFYAIKKNFKQGLLFGMIDFGIIAILAIDFGYFYQRTGNFSIDLTFFFIFALLCIYFVMRFYMYLMLITFDIKISKIFKHALIFSVIGIKRNILAIIGLALFTAIYVALFALSVPIGISFLLVSFMGIAEFIKAYAAYPNIEKYMVKE